jgi:hypothetical protein
MTPKLKAEEIYEKMISSSRNIDEFEAKQCALIAVDLIWQSVEHDRFFEMWNYWKEVKQEIEKL